MPGPDCDTRAVPIAYADSNSYGYADSNTYGDTYGFTHTNADAYPNVDAYAYTLRHRDNPKRWI
jgi:hypothetical protein